MSQRSFIATATALLLSGLIHSCTRTADASSNEPVYVDASTNPTHWRFSTETYKQEVVRLLIQEANRVAQELNLPENLPITRSNLIEIFVAPPGLGMAAPRLRGALGNVSTTNYVYHVNLERKFSGLIQRNLAEVCVEERKAYMWPAGQMDTNSAFNTAKQIMLAAGMDVAALNQDCSVEIRAPRYGRFFVPDYWVNWRAGGKLVAFVQFLEPARAVRQLQVLDPKYILRRPLEISNIELLLRATETQSDSGTNQLPAWWRIEQILRGTNSSTSSSSTLEP